MKICKARQICRDVHGRENPKRSWQNFWFAYENLLRRFDIIVVVVVVRQSQHLLE